MNSNKTTVCLHYFRAEQCALSPNPLRIHWLLRTLVPAVYGLLHSHRFPYCWCFKLHSRAARIPWSPGLCLSRHGVVQCDRVGGGASGGRGLCNPGKGLGAVFRGRLFIEKRVNDTVMVVVGQKGKGPCGVNPTHHLCSAIPTDISAAEACYQEWSSGRGVAMQLDTKAEVVGAGLV